MMRRLLASLLLAMALLPTAALAAPNTVTIEPFYADLTIQPGQAAIQSSVRLTNSSDVARTFKINAADLGGLDDTGGLILLGADATALQRKYGLISWLVLPQQDITIPAGYSSEITITIQNRDDLTPGGHYAAIVFQEVGDSQKPQVGLQQAVTELLLVRKLGGEKYDLQLDKVDVSTNPWRLPRNARLSFRNGGNIHLVPRGLIEVVGSGGQVVARGAINEDSAILLPERSRGYNVALDLVQKLVWPGRYQLRITYRYDEASEYQTITRGLFYLGNTATYILLGLIGLSIAATLLYVRRQ